MEFSLQLQNTIFNLFLEDYLTGHAGLAHDTANSAVSNDNDAKKTCPYIIISISHLLADFYFPEKLASVPSSLLYDVSLRLKA